MQTYGTGGYAPDGLPETLYSWAMGLGSDIANDLIDQIPGLGDLINRDPNEDYKDAKGKPVFMPWTNYLKGYEGGIADNSNSATYVEVWLNSSFVSDLFDTLYELLIPMMGIRPSSPTSASSSKTLLRLLRAPATTTRSS